MPTRALSDDQIENCFGVLAELRPHLQRDNFLATVRSMEEDGYKLVYMADQGRVVAVAGYRIYSNLFMGKHLYVDDLVTTE
ncbi:GNAT family N-acetyltransferase, partial [Gammaproteobacteria bacterium 54_18_T64]